MIKRILISSLLVICGGILTIAAQTDVNLKTRITLHNSIFEILDKPGQSQFKSGEKIFARLELINESSKEKWITTGQQWRYLRPSLVKDGEIIPYKSEILNLLNEGSPLYSPVVHFTLKPKVPTDTDHVWLDYWFDKLEAGHYTLSIERTWKNQTLESNQVEFDIVS